MAQKCSYKGRVVLLSTQEEAWADELARDVMEHFWEDEYSRAEHAERWDDWRGPDCDDADDDTVPGPGFFIV